MSQFVKASKRTRVVNSTVAGTTTIGSSIIDMLGFESVIFEALFGALSASQVTSIKVQGNTANSTSGMTDITGATAGPLADANSDTCLVVEVVKPQYRYVRCVVLRATGNAVIDGVMAIQHGAHKQPETDDATTVIATTSIVAPGL